MIIKINSKNQKLHFPSKILSILIVILLASTVVNAESFIDEREGSYDKTVEIGLKNLPIKEKLSNLREKMLDLFERLHEIKDNLKIDTYKTDNDSISILDKLGVLSSSSSLQFYANYDGIITETPLKIFRETKVDINKDDINDLGISYSIVMGIADFGLSIDFKFKFRKLEGYASLPDEKANFEGYVDIYFPGLLVEDLEGDHLRFGIESPDDEKIPEDLSMTYKFVPHLLSLKKKACHIFYLDPGVDSGKCDLNLVTSFTQIDDDNIVSEIKSKVAYDPIVESEIKIEGSRSLKDSYTDWTYERIRGSDSKVDLYAQFSEGNRTVVAYAKNLPNKVSYIINLENISDGVVEFDAYGEPVSEIGICDDFDSPKKELFFSNMFDYAKLEWHNDLFSDGKANASVYTEGSGVSFNMHVKGEDGSANFSAAPSNNFIDCSMELDIKQGLFILNHNGFDVKVGFDVQVTDESLSGYLSTLDGSFIIRKTDGELKIVFDSLFDGDAIINITGKTLEIEDLLITGNSPKLGGDFIVQMDYFKKEFIGSIVSELYVSKVGDNISGNCSFEVIGGVNITNLSIKFGDYIIHNETNLNVKYYWKNWFNFIIAVDLVEWYLAPDFSSGYILIKSSSYLYFSFSSIVKDNDTQEVLGEVSGSITLKTTSDVFNISWGTVDGNFSMNFDGNGVVKLEDFYLFLKDKAEASIPLIKGTFNVNTRNKSGEILLEVDDSVSEIHLDIDNINITDLFDISLNGSVLLDISGGADGYIKFAWDELGWAWETDFNLSLIGDIEITDFELSSSNDIIDVSFTRFTISGNLDVAAFKFDKNLTLVANGDLTNINISNLDIIVNIQPLHIPISIKTSDITFYGAGEINFEYTENIINASINMVGDSNILINALWVDALQMVIHLDNTEIHGPTTITVDIDTSKEMILGFLLTTTDYIYAEQVYLGPNFLIAWDVYGGSGGITSSFGVGVGAGHAQGLGGGMMPILRFDGSWYFSDAYLMGSDTPVSDIYLNGSISIELWFDTINIAFIYLNGVAYETTTIQLLKTLGDVEIILEPGNFNIMMQQGIFKDLGGELFNRSGHKYFYLGADVLNKAIIRVPGVGDIGFKGYVHFRLDLDIDIDKKINMIFDLNGFNGLFYIENVTRIIGEGNGLLNFSGYLKREGGNINISDIDIDISGKINASFWIKINDSWIPIHPFSTGGSVLLLVNERIKKLDKISVPNNNSQVHFEAWYTPPIVVGDDDPEPPYTYTIDYGDGSELYSLTSNNTEVFFPKHNYSYGEYTITVNATANGSNIATYNSSLIVFPGGYPGISLLGEYLGIYRLDNFDLNYEDVGEDGNFHFQFLAKNNADKDHPYVLEWEASVTFTGDWEGDDWTFEPQSGILNETETQLINATAPPPYDHKDHYKWPGNAWFGINNTNYSLYPERFDESRGIALNLWDGYVWFNPVDTIYIPVLSQGETKNSSFWIRNMGPKQLNWSIVDEGPYNATWIFSKTSGELSPYGGVDSIEFSITAPFTNGTDLTRRIKIQNDDNISDGDSRLVVARTKKNDSSLPPAGVEIIKDSDNVAIKIGGYININLDNFVFNVNDVNGLLNGHFNFDVTSSAFYINFSTSDLKNISFEGCGIFSVEDFDLNLDDKVSISVSSIVGDIKLKSGRCGNFSMEINESLLNVDIDIEVDYADTNFTLKGKFDMYLSSNSNGTMWFDWDLNGETPIVDFGGKIYREGTFTISVLNLFLELKGVTITADGLMLNGSDGIITLSGGEIDVSAEINALVVQNLTINADSKEFPLINSPLLLNGVFDLSSSGSISLKVNINLKDFELNIGPGQGTIEITDFVLDVNNSQLNISADSIHINRYFTSSGYLIFEDKNLTIDATGQIDISVTNLIFTNNVSQVTVEIPSLDLSIGLGVGKLIICGSSPQNSETEHTKTLGINEQTQHSEPSEIPDTEFYLKLSGEIFLTGSIQDTIISLENGKFVGISIGSGSGALVVNNLDAVFVSPYLNLLLSCDYLYLGVTVDGTFVIENSFITINGAGDVHLAITDLYLGLEGSRSIWGLGFSGDISLSIPSIDIELTAGADELKINTSKAPEITCVLPSNSSIYIGDTLQLVALVNMPEYQNQVEWTSLNPTVATVDSTGKVTAISIGSATINASLDGGSVSATVNIIGASSDFHIIPDIVTLNVGDQYELTTKNAAGSVYWESLDEDIASINETTGLLTVNAIGTATIQANDGSSYDTSTVISPQEITYGYDIVVKGDITLSGSGSASLNIIESARNAIIEIDLTNVGLSIDNFYLSVNETTSVIGDGFGSVVTKQLFELSWATLDLEGTASLDIIKGDEINTADDFWEFIIEVYDNLDISISDLEFISGSKSLVFDIITVESGSPGDLDIWTWTTTDTRYINWNSQNGFSSNEFAIVYHTEFLSLNLSVGLSGSIGRGSWASSFDLDEDGHVAIDTSTTIAFDLTLDITINDWALKVIAGADITADSWSVQWDPGYIWLGKWIWYPKNIFKMGTLTIDGNFQIKIKKISEGYLYSLYP